VARASSKAKGGASRMVRRVRTPSMGPRSGEKLAHRLGELAVGSTDRPALWAGARPPENPLALILVTAGTVA